MEAEAVRVIPWEILVTGMLSLLSGIVVLIWPSILATFFAMQHARVPSLRENTRIGGSLAVLGAVWLFIFAAETMHFPHARPFLLVAAVTVLNPLAAIGGVAVILWFVLLRRYF